jgi:hypothetical protein
MMDFTAYLAAQQLTREAVSEALPDAPIHSDARIARRRARSLAWRKQLSVTLRRLADLVEPLPEPGKRAALGCQ